MLHKLFLFVEETTGGLNAPFLLALCFLPLVLGPWVKRLKGADCWGAVEGAVA